MTPRLTASMLVSVLVRRVHAAGGSAMVLARGDAEAGAVLLDCHERGVRTGFRERVLGLDGSYAWQPVGPAADSVPDDIAAWVDRRRDRDPDLWIVELDIANAERFAAETTDGG
jgi:hypothetical protein